MNLHLHLQKMFVLFLQTLGFSTPTKDQGLVVFYFFKFDFVCCIHNVHVCMKIHKMVHTYRCTNLTLFHIMVTTVYVCLVSLFLVTRRGAQAAHICLGSEKEKIVP